MEDQIDLRPYLDALIKRWYLVIGVGVLLAIGSYIVTSQIPPTYEAVALVVIAEPRQRVQFDPRIETVSDNQSLDAYPELSLSDEVLGSVAELLDVPEQMTLSELRNHVDSEQGSDPTLLRLIVRNKDPQVAVKIATQWALYFVDWSNEIYGFQGSNQLLFFETQLEMAELDLGIAEIAMVEFQSGNRISTISNQLSALEVAQAEYLQTQQNNLLLIQDIEALRSLLMQNQNDSTITSAEQIIVLFLELRAFNIGATIPLQFNIDNATVFEQIGRDKQIDFLDDLIIILSDRVASVEDSLALLEPQILTLQVEREKMEISLQGVQLSYDISAETFTALARKVEEERITSQNGNSGIRLASSPAIPTSPIAPRRGSLAIMAGIVGMILANLYVFAMQWRSENH